ncbi:BtrH N-terminal domain-containing protein [Ancylomarina sp. YFZ004]
MINFEHRMSGHCENGVTSNILRHYNINLSEAMVFGLGSGLFFVHLPFIKLNGAPGTSYRPMPGEIFKRVNKVIGIKTKITRYKSNPEKAMSELDKKLEEGTPVGLVVGVYNLTYFPEVYRFHFNAHNIVAFGKKENRYIVSDPIMETPKWITTNDLKKVRYAKGLIKPKGKMYYVKEVPENFDLKKSIRISIKRTANQMLTRSNPFVGIAGIRLLAKSVVKWEKKLSKQTAAKYLGSIIRMQEEIGTGGAGFRFIYAAFLQESGKTLNNTELLTASKEMTKIGDMWRNFALHASRLCKSRITENESYSMLSNLLLEIADAEKKHFKNLLKLNLQ